MSKSKQDHASKRVEITCTEVQRQAFLDKADADWEVEQAEEQRSRNEVLPNKVIPFTSPITHPDIIVEENVAVRMRDGVILRADIFRPKAEGKYPVVIQRTPYDKLSTLDFGSSVLRGLAQRGYACIYQDVRGKFASDGEYMPFLNEIDDGVDSVEWAAEQLWSNGKVGQMGVSYGGFTSLSSAVGQAPHLCCIYPAMMEYGFTWRKTGIPPLQGVSAWHLWAGQGDVLNNPYRIDFNHLPLNEIGERAGFPNPQFDAMVCMDLDTVIRGEFSDEERNQRLALINAKTYVAVGWYDELLTGTVDTWCQIAKTAPDAKLMIGPWHHDLCNMEEARIGLVPTDDVELLRYYEQMEMFFAQHLKGEENAVSQADGPVKLYVMGRNVWRYEQEWPLSRTVYKPFYMHSNGNANSSLEDGVLDWLPPQHEQAADEYDYDPLNPISWSAGSEVWSYVNDMKGREEIQQRPDVLVYSSPVLQEDIEVTGTVAATLFAASDAQDTDFIACLVDVHPDGHTQYLTHGIIRARYRNGIEKPQLIEPGQVYKYEFEMSPTSNVFLKGHRIQIEVSSSDFNRYPRNQNIAAAPGQSSDTKIAHQTIFHCGAHLSHFLLPVIPNTTSD